jgi:hypothetical protein
MNTSRAAVEIHRSPRTLENLIELIGAVEVMAADMKLPEVRETLLDAFVLAEQTSERLAYEIRMEAA